MDDRDRALLTEHLRACQKIPRRGLPFPLAIKALTGCDVVPFDRTVEANTRLLAQLGRATAAAMESAAKKGIVAARPNEAGNQMEWLASS